MTEQQMKGTLEENILCALAWSDELAPEVNLQITAKEFSTRPFQKVARAAMDYYDQYGKPPKAHLTDILEADLLRGDDGSLIATVIESLERLAPLLQPAYVRDQLGHFRAVRFRITQAETALDALHKGDLNTANVIMAEQLPLPATSTEILFSDPEQSLKFLDQDENDYFSAGIGALDDRGVRPARKTLTIFMAPPKRGKSWFLVNVGKANVIRGKSVLHITLENSDALTSQRYVQAFCALTSGAAQQVSYPKFERDETGRFTHMDVETTNASGISDYTRDQIAKKILRLARRGPLIIKEFPTGSLTIPHISAYLDMLEKTKGFVPDILLLDYIDLMETDARNLRIDTGRVARALRGLAVQRNMAVITATQVNRVGADARTVTPTMVAEDYSKIGTADTIITYSQTQAEADNGLARLYVGAARGVRDRFTVMITQSYETGQFCLDSEYFDQFMQGEANRLTGGGIDTDEN